MAVEKAELRIRSGLSGTTMAFKFGGNVRENALIASGSDPAGGKHDAAKIVRPENIVFPNLFIAINLAMGKCFSQRIFLNNAGIEAQRIWWMRQKGFHYAGPDARHQGIERF